MSGVGVLTDLAPKAKDDKLIVMSKYAILTLIGALIWQSLHHAIELEKLELKLAWEESKKCVIPPPIVCPPPKVVELACVSECPPLECAPCLNYYEMCLE